MAKIHNSDTIKRILDDAGIQTSRDSVPQELASKVVPVLISNPKYQLKTAFVLRPDDALETILSTSATKRTFLMAMHLCVSKDASSDSTDCRIAGTPKGDKEKTLLQLTLEPTTAGQGLQTSLVLPIPLEMKKGTSISMVNNSATASIDISAIIYYYEVED